MSLIDKIFEHQSLIEKPPVLLDIGAASSIHPIWKEFSKYSKGIAFDADKREMEYLSNQNIGFRELFVFPCIVGTEDKDFSTFYLTNSPQCSSSLMPDINNLEKWSFAHLFEVDEELKLKTKSLISVLSELDINYIDWYKSDSQGTDLRLFSSLPNSVQESVIVADFEPGIIDAYIGEDKLVELMRYFENKEYWIADLQIKGDKRIKKNLINEINFNNLRISPGWGEITYLKEISENSDYNIRDILLAWVFSSVLGQHGYAIEIAFLGQRLFPNERLFDLLIESTKSVGSKEISRLSIKEKLKLKLIKLINSI